MVSASGPSAIGLTDSDGRRVCWSNVNATPQFPVPGTARESLEWFLDQVETPSSSRLTNCGAQKLMGVHL